MKKHRHATLSIVFVLIAASPAISQNHKYDADEIFRRLDALDHGNDHTPAGKEAINYLIEIEETDMEAIPGLILGLKHKDAKARGFCAGVLQEFGPQAAPAVPALSDLLTDGDCWVRASAASALGSIGPGAADAVPFLMNSLTDPNCEGLDPRRFSTDTRTKWTGYRIAIVNALGSIGPEAMAASPALLKTLKSKGRADRKEVVLTLGKIGDVAALDALIQIAEDDDEHPDVRGAAILGLAELGRLQEEARPQSYEAIETYVCEEDSTVVRKSAIKALGVLGAYEDSIQLLIESLDHDDNETCAFAANALGDMGEDAKESIPRLLESLREESVIVQVAAAEALGKMKALPDKVVPSFIQTLEENSSGPLAQSCAWALGEFGDRAEDAVEVLEALTESGDDRLKESAERSLKKIRSGDE